MYSALPPDTLLTISKAITPLVFKFQPLYRIILISIKACIISLILNKQQTIPLLTPTDPASYHPISLQPFSAKLLRKVTCIFCLFFLSLNSLLNFCSLAFDSMVQPKLSLWRSPNDHHGGKSNGQFSVLIVFYLLIVPSSLKCFSHLTFRTLLVSFLFQWPLFSHPY